ncbi:MAG: MlaA family lipoprotein [Candidatus Sphingomonas phytovorans]|nr:MlaA family lipoprotein [Sphingomonas sp.]WEK00019.1 MAG: MlaA family lipoprotein [Sphingomonas sp.]
MSIPAFTTALLLANASAGMGDTQPATPAMVQLVPAPSGQDVAQPAVPPVAAEPTPGVQPPPAEPAAMVPASAVDQNDIIVTARPRSTPGDPLSAVNAQSFEVTQSVDKAFVGPVALAYKKNIPGPIRSGLRNFLGNLREPVVFLNFLVQLKPGKAGETLGRFAVNSTIGGAGLFDVAKKRPFNLPRRPNGFADTLGYYGVKPGPFLFLPLIGPTTLRDLVGGGVDSLVLPMSFGTPFNKLYFSVPRGVISAIDYRAEFDEKLNELRESSGDPYTAARTFYLQRRQAEIDGLRGKRHKSAVPAPELTNPTLNPLGPTPRTSAPEHRGSEGSAAPSTSPTETVPSPRE